MAGYDPQSRRARPVPSEDSPVDGLLDKNPVAPTAESTTIPSNSSIEELSGDPKDDGLHPFEAPPIEMTDEKADLLHRFGALAAVVALVVVLIAWRRRRQM